MAIQFSYEPPKVDAGAVVRAKITAAEIAGAEALLAASQPLVPVDKGVLKASGHVQHGPDGAAVVYTAVNPADEFDYAAVQHEREDFHHDHGQAHYLSDPMRTEQAAIAAAMAAEVKI